MWTVSRPRPEGWFAERYASSLDRLADPRPHQRIGALHTLEALADEERGHAQAVVDVLTAYLRQPPAGGDGAVRATTQRMLAAHLRGGPRFWPAVELDLSGAVLTDLDLSGCRFATLNLDGA